MDPFLDNLTLEQLDGDAFDLAELIGMDAFKKLVEVYGGSRHSICSHIRKVTQRRT